MKIVAQSTVPANAPYLHIGYIAASAFQPNSPAMTSGFIIMLIGACLGTKLVIGKTRKGFTAFYVRWRDSKNLRIGGILVFIAGIVVMVLGYATGEEAYLRPGGMTTIRLYHMHGLISQKVEASEPVPEDIGAMKKEWKLENREVQDIWGRDLRVVKKPQNEQVAYSVISAGADGKFDTPDDITYPQKEK